MGAAFLVSDMTRSAGQTGQLKKRFLEVFAQSGNILRSAEAVGVNRNSVYEWLGRDEQFKAAYELAEQDALDLLVAEARRRAVEGVERPVYYKGERVDVLREYSDTLLIFLLKCLDRQRFGDKSEQEVTLRGGVEIYLPERTIRVDLDA